MGSHKLPALDALKLVEEFGMDAARETIEDVDSGRVRAETIQDLLYTDETREEFDWRVKNE